MKPPYSTALLACGAALAPGRPLEPVAYAVDPEALGGGAVQVDLACGHDIHHAQAAAVALGISERTLRYKLARMRERGMELPRRRSA